MNIQVRHVFLLALVLGFGAAGVFVYRTSLIGITPAIMDPPKDIAKLISEGSIPLDYPPGFAVSIFADGLPGVRVIAFDPAGTMLVSIPAAGRIVALPDEDQDGRADRQQTVIQGLNRPHGIAFAPGNDPGLYVAETGGVRLYDYDAGNMAADNGRTIVDLPPGGRHFTRTLLYLPAPDGDKLLIAVGSSCDTCRESDWRRAAILSASPDGSNLQVYAAGLRNAVFMRRHPETGMVWATEMGRDFLGDDLPPDEINIIRQGRNYGWPFCYGKNIRDRQFTPEASGEVSCSDRTPSHVDIQAHSAPLGLDFFPSAGWPPQYRNSMLIAYHGSWNRTVPTGYKIVRFRFDARGNFLDREDFISGWLTEENSAFGRPVDVRITDSGNIFISDDKAGIIYRLTLGDGDNPAGGSPEIEQ